MKKLLARPNTDIPTMKANPLLIDQPYDMRTALANDGSRFLI